MTYALGQGTGPLRGVRVVEIAGIGPGPHACMILADLGADVIRIDRPGGQPMAGGPARPAEPGAPERRPGPQGAGRGGDGARAGRHGPTCWSRGCGPAWPSGSGSVPRSATTRNPRLVYGRMTGWGQDGPLGAERRARPQLHRGHRDPARSRPGSGSARSSRLNLVGDFGGGSTYLVIGVLAALLEARTSGAGPGRRRRDRRRHRPPQRDGHGFLGAGPRHRAARHQPARRRCAVLRPLRDRRRPAHVGRRAGAPVLRRPSWRCSASRTPPPDRWTTRRNKDALRARDRRRLRGRAPRPSGRRSSPAPTPAWHRC